MYVSARITFWMMFAAEFYPTVAAMTTARTYVTLTSLKVTPVTTSLPVELHRGVESVHVFNYTFETHNVPIPPTRGWLLKVTTDNPRVAAIIQQQTTYIHNNNPSGNLTVRLKGGNAGRSSLRFTVDNWFPLSADSVNITDKKSKLDQLTVDDAVFPIFVIMEEGVLDKLFNWVIFMLVITANIGMGTQVDLNIVKKELTEPSTVCVAFWTQFIVMPLIAFGLSYVLSLEPGLALGLFALGCAPGGVASNVFSYYLGGSVTLSISITLINTLASFLIFPAWLFTLGSILFKAAKIQIPFIGIMVSLFIILVPTVIGIAVQLCSPKYAKILLASVKYILITILVFLFTVGVYVSWWTLDQMNTNIFLASAGLPYLGYIFGGFAAYITKRNTSDIITISIETGIQNTAVPMVLLNMTLTGPERTMSLVVPLISSTLTTLPLLVILLIKACIRKGGNKQNIQDNVAIVAVGVQEPIIPGIWLSNEDMNKSKYPSVSDF